MGSRPTATFLAILIVQAVALCWCGQSFATSVVPKPWRLVVYDAAFVGIVECEVAGVITADYRVIESYKGPPPGTVLRIFLGLETWHAGNPIALVGEQFLVYANRQIGPGGRGGLSSEPGQGEPYWWREIPCSLSTDPFWGFTPVDIEANEIIGSGHLMRDTKLSACRDSILSFFALPDETQEALVLNMGYPVCWLVAPSGSPPVTVRELLDSLMAVPIPTKNWYDDPAQRIASCGGDRALALLRSPEGFAKFGTDSTDWQHPIARILRRRGRGAVKPVQEVGLSSSVPDTLDELLTALERLYPDRVRDSGMGRRGSQSFAQLSVLKPQAVVHFLMSFDSQPKGN